MTNCKQPDSSSDQTAPGTSQTAPPHLTLLWWMPYRIPSRNRLDALPLRKRMGAKKEAQAALDAAAATAGQAETRSSCRRSTSPASGAGSSTKTT